MMLKDSAPIGKNTCVLNLENGLLLRVDVLSPKLFRIRYQQSEPWCESAMNRYGIESTPAQLLLNVGKRYAAPTISKTDGRPIALPEKGTILDAEFVIVETLDGRQVALRPYSAFLSVDGLPNGIYQLRSLGRKGRNHRIGFFSIKR